MLHLNLVMPHFPNSVSAEVMIEEANHIPQEKGTMNSQKTGEGDLFRNTAHHIFKAYR